MSVDSWEFLNCHFYFFYSSHTWNNSLEHGPDAEIFHSFSRLRVVDVSKGVVCGFSRTRQLMIHRLHWRPPLEILAGRDNVQHGVKVDWLDWVVTTQVSQDTLLNFGLTGN